MLKYQEKSKIILWVFRITTKKGYLSCRKNECMDQP